MNKTLYVKNEDDATWEKARRYIAFHEGKSLSDYLNEQVKAIVAKYEQPQDVKNLKPNPRKEKNERFLVWIHYWDNCWRIRLVGNSESRHFLD